MSTSDKTRKHWAMTRRAFLGSTTTMVIFGCSTMPKKGVRPRSISANEKVNIAGIGVGGKGASDVPGAGADNNVVALCDVDAVRAAKTFEKYPNAKKYTDFRVMLEKEYKNIDAVTVSTPDNCHAVAAMAAMQMGKHVYVQKPLTHDIYEARQLMAAARKYKVATQMGNQGHASEGLSRIREWIAAGVIGKVSQVYCWTNRPTWPQGNLQRKEAEPIPDTLKWDLWLGPAPERPYNKAYLPHNWRGWWDFGGGALGDMGCHIMDASYSSLNLGFPTAVTAESMGNTVEGGPSSSTVTFEYPARGAMPPVKLTWFDGMVDGKPHLPPRPKDIPADVLLGDKDNCGTLFIGEKGYITCDTYSGSPRVIPTMEVKVPKSTPKSIGHYKEWIEACKGGAPAGGNFDYACPFTETILLGNLAIRCGKRIEWDAANMRCTNVPEANELVKRKYRPGYSIDI